MIELYCKNKCIETSKMNDPVKFDEMLIAPCGMNCGTCLAYLREMDLSLLRICAERSPSFLSGM